MYVNLEYYFILLIFFFSGLMSFYFNFKYLLINLLSIEFMMLSLILNLYFNLLIFSYEMFFLMVFLSFVVCGGVLGISLLISLTRVMGNSNLNNLILLKI